MLDLKFHMIPRPPDFQPISDGTRKVFPPYELHCGEETSSRCSDSMSTLKHVIRGLVAYGFLTNLKRWGSNDCRRFTIPDVITIASFGHFA